MRATEELDLVAVLIRERRRSRVPLGEKAFELLAALGGPMARPAPPGPSGARVTLVAALLNRRPHPTLSLGRLVPREDQAVLHHLSLGPQAPRGDVRVKNLHRGSQGPRVDHVVPLLDSPTW